MAEGGGPSAYLQKKLPDQDVLVSWLQSFCKEEMRSYASKLMDTLEEWPEQLIGLRVVVLTGQYDWLCQLDWWLCPCGSGDPTSGVCRNYITFTSFMVSCGRHIILGWTLRKNYATSMDKPVLVRPWMLSYRKDFGVSSMVEPDVGSTLLQLFLTEGLVPEFVASISRQNFIQFKMNTWPEHGIRFMSDPDMVATEKLNLTKVPDAFLEDEYHELPAVIGGGHVLTLLQLFNNYLSCSFSVVHRPSNILRLSSCAILVWVRKGMEERGDAFDDHVWDPSAWFWRKGSPVREGQPTLNGMGWVA